jgi:hypothetical protein
MKNDTPPTKETALKTMKMVEMGLFHTPESVDDVVKFINSLPPHQRASAWTVYGLVNNLIVDRLRQGWTLEENAHKRPIRIGGGENE